MNTLPPNEPLDEQEREFARILHALPGGDPPPALDAAILRAAANAAASSNRPVRRMLASAGALWGIGTAAAAVLALGVAWQLRYGVTDRQAAETAAPRAHVVADVAQDDSVQVELDTQPADAPFVPPPPPPPSEALAAKPVAPTRFRQQPAQPARVAPAAAAPAAAPEAFADDHLDEHVAREAVAAEQAAAAQARAADAEMELKGFAAQKERQAMAKAAASNAAPPPPPAPMAAPAPASAAESSLDKVSVVGGARDDAAAGVGAGALARAEPAKTEAPLRKPGTWLADIRKLRDAGKIEEARASLVEFRKKYPKWVVPTDLAPLLSE